MNINGTFRKSFWKNIKRVTTIETIEEWKKLKAVWELEVIEVNDNSITVKERKKTDPRTFVVRRNQKASVFVWDIVTY